MKAGLVVLVVVALLAGLTTWARRTYTAGQAQGQQTVQLQALRQQADLLRGLRQREHQLATQLAAQDTAHAQETAHAHHQNQLLRDRLRAGTQRLSVPTTSCTATGAGSGAARAADHAHEARAELAPEAAADLVAIADDGDSAIRDLNACIDRHRAIERTLNAPLMGTAAP